MAVKRYPIVLVPGMSGWGTTSKLNELLPYWEDRWSVALKSPSLSFAVAAEDPKTGKNKYFTDLTALKMEILDADGSSTEPVPEPAEVPPDVLAGDTDDLPF